MEARPEHASIINTGYISIEYLVINTSLPVTEAAIRTSVVKNAIPNNCKFNLSFIKDLKALPQKAELVLKDLDKIKKLAQDFFNCKNIFFIGRNVDYAVALEGALKAKEISYIHSEAYAAGELKHGTISLVEDGTFVVALATNEDLFEKMISNIREVKARGAVVLLVTTEKLAKTQNEEQYIYLVFVKNFPILLI